MQSGLFKGVYEYPSDTPDIQAFEEDFPFVETEDQLRAVDAIKNDMQSKQSMDRLICGDVGYGKTEVAMRAAFKAVVVAISKWRCWFLPPCWHCNITKISLKEWVIFL